MRSFRDILQVEVEATRTRTVSAPAADRLTPRDWISSSRALGTLASARRSQQHERLAAKRRFRAQALATHPDRGGSAAAFIAAVQTYEQEIAAV